MEEQFEYLLSRKVLVEAIPVDSWTEWHWRITLEDCMAPFFTFETSDPEQLYTSHKEAMISGIKRGFEIINEICPT